VLGKVVTDLNLQETWAKKKGQSLPKPEAVGLLRQKLELRRVPNTSLAEVGVKSETPQEAAKLANAVVDAYANYQQESRAKLRVAGSAALQTNTTSRRPK